MRHVFGQNRSDHVPFAAARALTVFFTDWTGGCHHTVLDDIEHLDDAELELQIGTTTDFVEHLLTTVTPPCSQPIDHSPPLTMRSSSSR